MRIWRHHDDEPAREEPARDEQPTWQASKVSWGEVSIDAPTAAELRSPERAA